MATAEQWLVLSQRFVWAKTQREEFSAAAATWAMFHIHTQTHTHANEAALQASQHIVLCMCLPTPGKATCLQAAKAERWVPQCGDAVTSLICHNQAACMGGWQVQVSPHNNKTTELLGAHME